MTDHAETPNDAQATGQAEATDHDKAIGQDDAANHADANQDETTGVETSSSLLTRRHLLMLVSVAAGGFATAIVSLPLVGFLIAPLFQRDPPVWRTVGPLNKFPVGETSKVTLEDSSSLAWGGADSETAAWLRRVDEKTFEAFSVDCTHLGCPVRWEASAQLFMCPCHGGVYYADGEVAAGPPPHSLQQFPVRILNNNTVQVEWRKLPAIAGNCPHKAIGLPATGAPQSNEQQPNEGNA